MKKHKKKNFMLIWLFLTALLLSTTTYAWFSANRIFEINTFDIHIVSREGIEVSTDGINWKGVVGLMDFFDSDTTYPQNLNQIPNSLMPVSSGGEIENNMLKIYYGQIDQGFTGEQYLSARRDIESKEAIENDEAKFIVFDLFLKTASRKMISISPVSSVAYIDGSSNGIENAFRLGFLNQGFVPLESNINQIQNIKGANRSYIWETNNDTHTASGVLQASDIYGLSTQETNAQRLDYYGVIDAIPRSMNVNIKEANSIKYPNHFKKMVPDVSTTKNNNQFKELFNIEAGISKIRTYIWIEGQDVDCENDASIANVSINLQFVADQP